LFGWLAPASAGWGLERLAGGTGEGPLAAPATSLASSPADTAQPNRLLADNFIK